jgi:hypothetical protein
VIGNNGLELYVGDIWAIAGSHFLILGERCSQAIDREFPEFETWDLNSQSRKVLLFTSRPDVYTLVACLVCHERLLTNETKET